MKKIFLFTTWIFTSYIFISQQQGVNLRGQVRAVDPVNHSSVPLSQVAVNLYTKEPADGNWRLIAASSTNENGFYYFNRITPGNYFIQVNRRKNYDIRVKPIDQRRQDFLDLPVLNY